MQFCQVKIIFTNKIFFAIDIDIDRIANFSEEASKFLAVSDRETTFDIPFDEPLAVNSSSLGQNHSCFANSKRSLLLFRSEVQSIEINLKAGGCL